MQAEFDVEQRLKTVDPETVVSRLFAPTVGGQETIPAKRLPTLNPAIRFLCFVARSRPVLNASRVLGWEITLDRTTCQCRLACGVAIRSRVAQLNGLVPRFARGLQAIGCPLASSRVVARCENETIFCRVDSVHLLPRRLVDG